MKQKFSIKNKKYITMLIACCLLGNVSIGAAAQLSLGDAVDMALKNNFKVKIAEKGQEKAKVRLEGTKGQQRPSVVLSSSMGVSDVDDRGFSRNNSNSIRLSMPIYTGGKNELSVAKAKEDVTKSELALARTRENLMLETVTAYYDILEAQKLVKVDEETVKNYEQHLASVKNLYEAGSSPKVDLLRSEVELVNAKQNLLKSQNTYDIAVSTLKSIIKMEGQEELKLSDEANYKTFTMDLAECIRYAQANRKDLKQAQLAVDQAEKDVKIAQSEKLPTVSMSIGNSWDKQLVPSNDNHSLNANVSASWNVFDSNVTNSSIRAAEIAVEEANFELLKEMDAVELEVRQNYLKMKEAEKRFHTTEVAVQKAQEDYYIANEKYKAGEGIMLDIIDAQLALSTAKNNYIQAQYDYATYRAKLENAMGLSEGNNR